MGVSPITFVKKTAGQWDPVTVASFIFEGRWYDVSAKLEQFSSKGNEIVSRTLTFTVQPRESD